MDSGLTASRRAGMTIGRFATKRKCPVTKIVQKTATLQSLQICQLTKEEVYRLWKCAIKDDDRLVDALIQKVYDTMIAFDLKRAEIVIGLIVDRHEAAEPAFQDFSETSMRLEEDLLTEASGLVRTEIMLLTEFDRIKSSHA
jgi:hypothetical protein